jgi:hypothetical protein
MIKLWRQIKTAGYFSYHNITVRLFFRTINSGRRITGRYKSYPEIEGTFCKKNQRQDNKEFGMNCKTFPEWDVNFITKGQSLKYTQCRYG